MSQSTRPEQAGHRERLRERFVKGGPDALPDYELLELLLAMAIPRGDVKPTAKALLRRFKNFPGVVDAPVEALREVDGMGKVAPVALKVVRAAAQRLLRQEVVGREAFSSFEAVIDYCRVAMAFEPREEFRVLFLDRKNRLIDDEVQQKGSVDHAPVLPRRGRARGPGAPRHGRHSGAQPSLGRSDAEPGRHRHDQGGGGGRQGGGRDGARPYRDRARGPCQLPGVGSDVTAPGAGGPASTAKRRGLARHAAAPLGATLSGNLSLAVGISVWATNFLVTDALLKGWDAYLIVAGACCRPPAA